MFNFPWSNFHELNLDWILSVVKEAKEVFDNGRSDIDYAVETADEAKEIATQAAEATIADNSISTQKLQNGAVTNAKLANNSVTTANIVDRTIIGDDIAENTIESYNIKNGTIIGADIASNTIQTTNLVNGCVNNAQIADNAVTNPKIANATITYDKLAVRNTQNANYFKFADGGLKIIWGATDVSTDSQVVTLPLSVTDYMHALAFACPRRTGDPNTNDYFVATQLANATTLAIYFRNASGAYHTASHAAFWLVIGY